MKAERGLHSVSVSIIHHPLISSQPSQRTALHVLLKLCDPKPLNVTYCGRTAIWFLTLPFKLAAVKIAAGSALSLSI